MMAVFALLALVTTLVVSGLGGFITTWNDLGWALLLFVGAFLAWIVLFVLFAFFVTLPVNTKKPIKKPSKFYTWLFYLVNNCILDCCNYKIHIHGGEKLDPNINYLFVYNHRANTDSMIVPRLFRKYNILLISKPENFRIPIAGKAIHAAGYLSVDRDNDRKAIEAILRAANYLKNGHSIGLCPEGRRNKDGIDLLPFKNGAFKVAQRAKAPIVLMTLNGTENIKHNAPFKRTTIHLDILEVLPVEQVLAMSTQEIGDHAMQIMQAKIDEYKAQN